MTNRARAVELLDELVAMGYLRPIHYFTKRDGEPVRFKPGFAVDEDVAAAVAPAAKPALTPELEQLAKLAACMTGEVGVGMRARFAANLLEVVPSGAGLVRDARIPAKTTRAEARALATRLLRDLVTELEREEDGR